MAKKTSSRDSPLQLHEVLEAEFIALHGKEKLPPDYHSSTEPGTRLTELWGAVHRLDEGAERAALCISGGGIRSATFGLGILQGLARCGLLDKFHYLSTVSGGGYIGSWLSAWIRNDPHPHGMKDWVTKLTPASSQRPNSAHRNPDSILDSEPRPIRHLREFSNYLAPRASLTSMDFWTLIATFIRNMFLNWLVLISWLAAAMMIPRLCLAPIYMHPVWHDWTISVQQRWDISLAVLLTIGFGFVALSIPHSL